MGKGLGARWYGYVPTAWLQSRQLKPIGSPTYAYYNDPFIPGPLRRNEVMFEMAGE